MFPAIDLHSFVKDHLVFDVWIDYWILALFRELKQKPTDGIITS